MRYTVEKIPNEPITVWTAYPEWDWYRDTDESNGKVFAIWNASPEPMYHIVDVLRIKFNMQDLIYASSGAAHGETALFAHPKMKMAVIVVQDPLVVDALNNIIEDSKSNTSIYRPVPMVIVDTKEKALDTIHRHQRGQV